jgi:hypothetical protein
LRFRPALVGDGFTREVDHGVKAVEILPVRQPFPDLHAGAQHLARFLRAAGHHRDRVARLL